MRSALLTALFTTLWLVGRPAVGALWTTIFATGFQLMAVPATATFVDTPGWLLPAVRPVVEATGALPGTSMIVATGVITLVVFVASFWFPASFTPVTYLLRAVCFIQATAVIYFHFVPDFFPHEAGAYTAGMIEITMAFISLIPALMGLTYYIFDFSLLRKTLLTALTMTHLVIMTPLQYMLHVNILVNGSVLFMPALYIVFGVLPQIAIFIAFYSWGMSWPDTTSDGTPVPL